MAKTLSVGILGCGMVANYHAKAISEIPSLSLVGAFDAYKPGGEKFCESYGIRLYSSDEELMRDAGIDIVSICLPSGLHYPMALACIRAGKHVILEKPMAFTAAEADEIIAEADKMGVKVTVISQLRYTPAVTALKKAVEEGHFGRVVSADIYMKYYRSEDYYTSSNWKGTLKMDGGGALMNQGIHGVDLLQYVAGPVVSVQAIADTKYHKIETEDIVSALLEFKSGAFGVIQATTCIYPGFQRRLEISGTEGSVVLTEDTIAFSDFKNPAYNLDCGVSKKATGSRPDGMDHSLHKTQIADFAEAIAENRRPFIDASEGKRAVAIIDAVYRSAKTGEKVYIN
ncbi:MAG: Gfo/Idh/MocA family oxidoreductase [Clostridia bacterium]|nr:Gfo/Idh/MocA family oxidoreductase [Clostridia bacterium]